MAERDIGKSIENIQLENQELEARIRKAQLMRQLIQLQREVYSDSLSVLSLPSMDNMYECVSASLKRTASPRWVSGKQVDDGTNAQKKIALEDANKNSWGSV